MARKPSERYISTALPMIEGIVSSGLKAQFRGTEAGALFGSVVDPDDDSKEWMWERLSGRKWDTICAYVFHCKTCNRFKSTWDMD